MGKADVDALSNGSSTALHHAALYDHLEVAALLIERGAKVNPVNSCGNTPLDMEHRAYHDNTEMIALLKSKRAKRASELLQAST